MSREIAAAVRDGIARAAAVVGLAGVALIHLLDAPGKFTETPYMGGLYVALMAGCLLTAAALVHGSDRRAWLAAVLLPAGAITGYVLTRTVGLPQAHGDIGNWLEPLGLASLFVEGALVSLAAGILGLRLVPRALSTALSTGKERAPTKAATPGAARTRALIGTLQE